MSTEPKLAPGPGAPPAGRPLEPYRTLFPMGVAFGAIGAGAWPLYALGVVPYPGRLHLTLMMQGFEQSFVVGFLLTAMPAFTHGPRCHPLEFAAAVTLLAAYGVAAVLGANAPAQLAFLLTLALLATAGVRRIVGNPQRPPEEFLFVGFGLALGAAGAVLGAFPTWGAGILPPRFAERLLSLGMVLSIVVGVGSLLVPTFAGLRAPLAIPGVAGPHERRGRRPFFVAVLLTLLLAFALELARHPTAGMAVRATAATVMILWVWKLTRRPRADVPAFVLWTSGWMVLAGLWAAVALPLHATAALHLTFIGGFALLTLGIGTRVVVAHGKHPLEVERRTLSPGLVAALAAALILRLAAELDLPRSAGWLAASGLAWLVVWGMWGARALPLIARAPLPPRPRG